MKLNCIICRGVRPFSKKECPGYDIKLHPLPRGKTLCQKRMPCVNTLNCILCRGVRPFSKKECPGYEFKRNTLQSGKILPHKRSVLGMRINCIPCRGVRSFPPKNISLYDIELLSLQRIRSFAKNDCPWYDIKLYPLQTSKTLCQKWLSWAWHWTASFTEGQKTSLSKMCPGMTLNCILCRRVRPFAKKEHPGYDIKRNTLQRSKTLPHKGSVLVWL